MYIKPEKLLVMNSNEAVIPQSSVLRRLGLHVQSCLTQQYSKVTTIYIELYCLAVSKPLKGMGWVVVFAKNVHVYNI